MMEIIKFETNSFSFKEIKQKIESLSVIDELKSGRIHEIINWLSEDRRKNVLALKSRIEKQIERYNDELCRVRNMYEFDKSFGNYKYIAGVDEVGRGPLAGPIVACSVILDLNVIDEDLILYLNDSKKLKEEKREELSEIIKQQAICYSISMCTNVEIDEKGIGVANNKVFLESCKSLSIRPDLVLSDGYLVKNLDIENKYVIKGDTKSACIAAASILAKVYRDNIMKEYSKKYKHYDFHNNMGYGTVKHIEGLKKYGKCDIHRNTFLTKIM